VRSGNGYAEHGKKRKERVEEAVVDVVSDRWNSGVCDDHLVDKRSKSETFGHAEVEKLADKSRGSGDESKRSSRRAVVVDDRAEETLGSGGQRKRRIWGGRRVLGIIRMTEIGRGRKKGKERKNGSGRRSEIEKGVGIESVRRRGRENGNGSVRKTGIESGTGNGRGSARGRRSGRGTRKIMIPSMRGMRTERVARRRVGRKRRSTPIGVQMSMVSSPFSTYSPQYQ
jgi:hypothetical protein